MNDEFTVLKLRNPRAKIIAVEPADWQFCQTAPPGAHTIEGIGIGYAPLLWQPVIIDKIVPIFTADAEAMARRLAREEGLLAGTSSGGNVLAAIRIGQQLGPSARVATLLVDSGLKYLATEVYRR